MLDFFRGEMTCDALLGFIDHLPSDSAYFAEVAEDDEYAELLLEQEQAGQGAPAAPRMTEFSPEVRVMAAMFDRLSYLVAVQIARANKTPPRFDPYPRPVTALERKRRHRAQHNHQALVSRMLNRSS